MHKYGALFSEARIGSLPIKNRLVMTAMGCGYANPDGTLNERFIAYYERRAKGGVGLIITEVTRVNSKHGKRTERQICVDKDIYIPGLRSLSDAVHKHGAKIFVQLHHPGMWTTPNLVEDGILLTPSGVPSTKLPLPVRAMTVEEIHSLVQDFADGAYRAKLGGIDGVEIHGAHFYLLHTFLSPYFNRRDDQYGGSLENRTRIICQIIQAIREKCGHDYPIMVRLSADEFMGDNGYHLDEGIRIAKLLEECGCDALDITGGGAESGSSHSIEPPSYRQGWKNNLGEAIKKSVNIPVCMVSAIREPAYANKLIEEERVDLIGMGRSYLADPDWPIKAQNGQDEDICRCISCRRCITEVSKDQPVVCSVNPDLGTEYATTPLMTNGNGRKVIVTGGGVAGMTAAFWAAKRGFCTELYEAGDTLGGAVALAAQVPYNDKMKWLLRWLERECKKAGVCIHRNKPLTASDIKSMTPYAVILATGAQPVLPHAKNCEVYSPADILSGHISPTEKTCIVVGGGLTGLEVAEYLVQRNNRVTLYARTRLGGDDRTVTNDCLKYLHLHDTVIIKNRQLTKIQNHYVYTEDIRTGETYVLPADCIVAALGIEKDDSLAQELSDEPFIVLTVGDAAGHSRIKEAIETGKAAALAL